MILSLVCQILYSRTEQPSRAPALGSPSRSPTFRNSHFVGVLFLCTVADCYSASGAVALIYAGAVILALAVVTLGVGLLRSPQPS